MSIWEKLKQQLPRSNPSTTLMNLENIFVLYVSHALRSWGIRLYNFSIPLILAEMYRGTMFPGAFFTFFSMLFLAILGSHIGYLVDKHERLYVMMFSLIVQNCMVAFCGCIFGILALMANATPYETWTSTILYGLGVFFGGVITLSQAASDISIEKDWAIILSEDNDLSATNAMLRRINLISDVLSPMAFSVLIYFTSYMMSAMVISIWYVVSFFPEMFLLIYLYIYEPKLAKPKKKPKSKDNFIMALVNGWKLYFSKDIFFASFSYVCLFMIVLNPGVLFTIWLKSKDFGDLEIGGFRSISALTGVLVTFVTPTLFSRFGISNSALLFISLQLICLIVGVACVTVTNAVWAIWVLMGMICLAKMGLWGFALAEMEIMQQGIPEDERGIVNATEKSFSTVAYLSVMLMGVIVSDPNDFWYLMIINVDAYVLAWVCFFIYWWFYRKDESIKQFKPEEAIKEQNEEKNGSTILQDGDQDEKYQILNDEKGESIEFKNFTDSTFQYKPSSSMLLK